MYQLTAFPTIIRKGGKFIPVDPLNRDYAEYLAWLAEGNAPDPYIAPPPPIPQSVSAFQAKAALLNAGLLNRVEAMMASPTAPALAKLAWREAGEFQRESPTILTLAASLELTAEQLDDLFIAAAQVTA